jgi:predicted O-methyltransferase YrrM
MTTAIGQHIAALHAEYTSRLGPWSDIQGHLTTLYDTVRAYPSAVVLELGVRWATSTAALLAGAAEVGGHVWSVDIAHPTYPEWWHDTGMWTLTVGDDTDPLVSLDQPDLLDVLFIDTSHAYDHTLHELRLYVPRVKPGGTVLLHDTELEAPELVGEQPPFPVAKALDVYCGEVGIDWENRTGSYGLGVIHIPGSEAV